MKVLVETLGCRANHYDSERVKAMVMAGGGEIVTDAELADVAVYNSCAVTADAEADLRQKVRRGARRNPRLRSVIMGCASGFELSRRTPDAERGSLKDLPTVDALVGGADLAAIGAALGIATSAPASHQTGARALLRIQDGCDEHCTFCATTIARGANRSRDISSLVEEAERLADSHHEIVLTGVHIGSYGKEFRSSLSHLVGELIQRVPRVRFRLSSLEATEVDNTLIELIHAVPDRLTPYLHAPLQSGSDRVLKRMGRSWYTSESYSRAIARVVNGSATFGLGADVIAGFPGETDDDHALTVRLVKSLPFTSLHVFPFSARAGTAAPRLPGAVPSGIIATRARELRAIAATKADEYRKSRTGGTADVVVIKCAKDGAVGHGLTGDYLTVGIQDMSIVRGERFTAVLSAKGDAVIAARIQEQR